jgi:hypothetical protein
MGVACQRHVLAALLPEKTRYPLCGRLGGPQGLSGGLRKISPHPPGLCPRTVQSVASRYTDSAVPTPRDLVHFEFIHRSVTVVGRNTLVLTTSILNYKRLQVYLASHSKTHMDLLHHETKYSLIST